MEIKKIRYCPICKSTRITYYAGGITGSYECKKCGYVGTFIIELVKKRKKEKLAKRRR